MFRKTLLHSFHKYELCNKICKNNYPWGWKTKKYIIKYKNYLINKNSKNKEIKYELFNENEFLKNSFNAYNQVYKGYINNIDFLDFEYTSPKLSNALNFLRNEYSKKSIEKLPKNIDMYDSKILSCYVKNDITTNNFKFLGYYCNNQIGHEISAGAIGPEIKYIWDQLPNKQIINVLYKSDKYYDIVEWECDLLLNDPEWQISNINNILIN